MFFIAFPVLVKLSSQFQLCSPLPFSVFLSRKFTLYFPLSWGRSDDDLSLWAHSDFLLQLNVFMGN